MFKLAATEFQPTAKQGKAWGGSAAFKRAKGARNMLYNIRKQNPELTAQQAFRQMRAGADKSLFKGWTKEDMNLFIDRYVTNDPHQKNYYNQGKLFSNKKGQLFNKRSALEEDRLIDKPMGQTLATARSSLASLGSGLVGGLTFMPELAWSGAKTLAGGLSGKGWKWRSTDWNPLDNLNVDSNIADYKTAGKTIQRGFNAAGETAGYIAPVLISGGMSSGSLLGAGTKSARHAGKLASRFAAKSGKGFMGQQAAKFTAYKNVAMRNAKTVGRNMHNLVTNPVGSAKSYGTTLANNFKKAPLKTVGGTAMNIAFGPGAVAGAMIGGPSQPMNDYYAGGNRPNFQGAVNAAGEQVQ